MTGASYIRTRLTLKKADNHGLFGLLMKITVNVQYFVTDDVSWTFWTEVSCTGI